MIIHFCEFSMCIAQLTVSPRFSFLHAEQFFQDVGSMMYFLCIFASFSTFLSNFQACYQCPSIFHVCLLFFSILVSINNPYLFHGFPYVSLFIQIFAIFFHVFSRISPPFCQCFSTFSVRREVRAGASAMPWHGATRRRAGPGAGGWRLGRENHGTSWWKCSGKNPAVDTFWWFSSWI